MNTSFDRDASKQYGVNSIHFIDDSNYAVEFIPLKLPRLIRKTLKVDETMKQDTFNHTIYEVTGSIDQLAKVKNSELLDKKIALKPTENSKLDLKNLSLVEELTAYLAYSKVSEVDEIVKDFQNLNLNVRT
jgi:hypothetical protein